MNFLMNCNVHNYARDGLFDLNETTLNMSDHAFDTSLEQKQTVRVVCYFLCDGNAHFIVKTLKCAHSHKNKPKGA